MPSTRSLLLFSALVTLISAKTINTKDRFVCKSPFDYNGKTYTDECATEGHTDPWCYVDDIIKDVTGRHWDSCQATDKGPIRRLTTEGIDCIFPFTHNGKTYQDCTTEITDAPVNGKNICSIKGEMGVTTNELDLTGKSSRSGEYYWGECSTETKNFVLPSNVPTNCVFPWYDEVGQTEHLGCAVAAYDDAWCSINTVYKSTDHDKEGVEWEWCRPQMSTTAAASTSMGSTAAATTTAAASTSAASTSAAKTTLGFTSSPKPTTAGPCEDTFKKLEDKHNPGGTFLRTANTVELCKEACLKKSDCSGFEFTSINTCWLTLFHADLHKIENQDGIDVYVRESCEVSTEMPTTTPKITTSTLSTSTKKPTTEEATTMAMSSTAMPTTDVSTTSMVPECFKQLHDKRLSKFNDYLNIFYDVDMKDCVSECEDDDKCVSFEYIYNLRQCVTSKQDLHDDVPTDEEKGVGVYEKIPDCKMTSMMTTTMMTTTEKEITTSTPMPTTSTPKSSVTEEPGCDVTNYTKHAGMHIKTGNDVLLPGKSLEECMQECDIREACLSFKYTENIELCVLARENLALKPENTEDDATVDLYEKRLKCFYPTTTVKTLPTLASGETRPPTTAPPVTPTDSIMSSTEPARHPRLEGRGIFTTYMVLNTAWHESMADNTSVEFTNMQHTLDILLGSKLKAHFGRRFERMVLIKITQASVNVTLRFFMRVSDCNECQHLSKELHDYMVQLKENNDLDLIAVLDIGNVTAQECGETFLVIPNKHAYGGEPVPGPIKHVDDCIAFCLGEDKCISFDLDKGKATPACFWHDDMKFLHDPRDSGVLDHYERSKCEQKTTKQPRVSTRKPFTPPMPHCKDTYKKFENTNSQDGMRVRRADSAKECEDACSSMPSCVGFDFDKELEACFVHHDIMQFHDDNTNMGTAEGVDQYRRVKCDEPTKSTTKEPEMTTPMMMTTTECVDSFHEIENTFHPGLRYDHRYSSDNYEDCENHCRMSDDCDGFDYNILTSYAGNRCRIFNHIDPQNQRRAIDFLGNVFAHHYRRMRCGPMNKTTTTTTEATTMTPKVTTPEKPSSPTPEPTTPETVAPPVGLDCPLDIIIAVDSSGSVVTDYTGTMTRTGSNWVNLKLLVTSMVEMLVPAGPVGNNNRLPRVGLNTFSNISEVVFNLGDYSSGANAVAKAATMRDINDRTNTFVALNHVGIQFASHRNRREVPDAVIVITDGIPNGGRGGRFEDMSDAHKSRAFMFVNETIEAADFIRGRGIDFNLIGVGHSDNDTWRGLKQEFYQRLSRGRQYTFYETFVGIENKGYEILSSLTNCRIPCKPYNLDMVVLVLGSSVVALLLAGVTTINKSTMTSYTVHPGGNRIDIRYCNSPSAAYGGRQCQGQSQRSFTCNTQPCGGWGPWVTGACSVTCGVGQALQTRNCLGGSCVGESSRTVSCTETPCPYRWSNWINQACSVTCGGGSMVRTRSCLEGNCVGNSQDVISCNTQACPNFRWSAWVNGQCSATCGGGSMTRTRSCLVGNCVGNTQDVVACNTQACFRWSAWVSGSCSVSCGVGSMVQTRSCLQGQCVGPTSQAVSCNQGACPTQPVHGGWSAFQAASGCSAQCGAGQQQFIRQCNNPPPSNGGNACSGSDVEFRACTGTQCGSRWTSWSFSSCSVTCGTSGSRQRSRQCNNPGGSCDGSPHGTVQRETVACDNMPGCPSTAACNNKDVALLIDLSGSILFVPNGMATLRDWCRSMASALLGGASGTRVAIVTFGDYAQVYQDFTSTLSTLETACRDLRVSDWIAEPTFVGNFTLDMAHLAPVTMTTGQSAGQRCNAPAALHYARRHLRWASGVWREVVLYMESAANEGDIVGNPNYFSHARNEIDRWTSNYNIYGVLVRPGSSDQINLARSQMEVMTGTETSNFRYSTSGIRRGFNYYSDLSAMDRDAASAAGQVCS